MMYKKETIINDTLDAIAFGSVLKKIAENCFSGYGKRKVLSLRPVKDPTTVIDNSIEFFDLLLSQGEPPFGGISDLLPQIEKTNLGNILEGNELLRISDTFKSVSKLRSWLENLKDSYPLTWQIAQEMNDEPSLTREIDRCIDGDGNVSNRASDLLRRTRNELSQLNRNMRAKIDSIMSRYRTDLTDNLVLTREGRYVIPLSASKKNLYQGIIHGSSGSGVTVYFEPVELIQLNDKLRLLESTEREEVQRILSDLTRKFFTTFTRLKTTLRSLEQIDLMYSSVRYARKTQQHSQNPGLTGISW